MLNCTVKFFLLPIKYCKPAIFPILNTTIKSTAARKSTNTIKTTVFLFQILGLAYYTVALNIIRAYASIYTVIFYNDMLTAELSVTASFYY